MRHALICFCLLLFACKKLPAQSEAGRLLWQAKEIKLQKEQQKKLVKFWPQSSRPETLTHLFLPVYKASGLSANHFYQQLGWVCRQEWQFEKKTSIPFRLRLGSTDQVDYLEGKQQQRMQR